MKLVYSEIENPLWFCPECKTYLYNMEPYLHKKGCTQTNLDNCEYHFNAHTVRLAKKSAEIFKREDTEDDKHPVSVKTLKEQGYHKLLELIPAITDKELEDNLRSIGERLYHQMEDERFHVKFTQLEMEFLLTTVRMRYVKLDDDLMKEAVFRILKKLSDFEEFKGFDIE